MPSIAYFVQTLAHQMRLHPFYRVVAACSALAVIVVVATVAMLWQQHNSAIEAAGTNLQNLSWTVADQTDRVFESLDLAEDRLIDRMAIDRDGNAGDPMDIAAAKSLQPIMRDIVANVAEMYALILVNANGDLVNFSYSGSVPIRSVADRSYYKFALAHPEVKNFISDTVNNRQTGTASFSLIRRLNGPDGTFEGLLLGAVQVAYLQRLFAASMPLGGAVTLFRDDGSLLVRQPGVALATTQGREAAFRASYFGAEHGPVLRSSPFDKVERLTAMSSLPRYPVKIAVSEPISYVLAAWRLEAAWIGTLTALGCLTTTVIVVLAFRRFHDQQRLEAVVLALKVEEAREHAERETAEQHARFGMALDNMCQGLVMFDSSNRLLLVNAAFFRIFEIQPGELQPGMLYTDAIRVVASTW